MIGNSIHDEQVGDQAGVRQDSFQIGDWGMYHAAAASQARHASHRCVHHQLSLAPPIPPAGMISKTCKENAYALHGRQLQIDLLTIHGYDTCQRLEQPKQRVST